MRTIGQRDWPELSLEPSAVARRPPNYVVALTGASQAAGPSD